MVSVDGTSHIRDVAQYAVVARRTTYAPTKNENAQAFVVGPHVSLTGILKVNGEIRIEGRLEADIRCHTLLVAPEAQIDGVIVADRIEIYGVVKGEVYCNRVVVKDNSRVEAELNYRSLELEPGAFFEGRSRRYSNPIEISPAFD